MTHTMLTLPEDLLFDMEKEEFVALARKILDEMGERDSLGRRVYSDDWVEICTNTGGLELEITRQKQPVMEGMNRSHLRVSNPTTMVVPGGEVIRHHGEHIYITWHMKQLGGEE